MPTRLKIRLASEADLKDLVHLEQIAFETDRFTEEQIDYFLTRSRATTFILDHGTTMAGSACVLWRKSVPVARIYNLAVNPAYQGKGYGALLLKEVEKEAVRRNCTNISLEVRQDNEGAIRFYEKRGYEIIRSLPDYYEDNAPGLKMAKKLPRSKKTELHLNIPYYAQTLDFTCGPACIMMVLKYFWPDVELTRALEMRLWKEATLIFMMSGFGGTDPYGLALSALERGMNCRVIISMDKTPMLRSVRIPQKREIIKIVHGDLKRRARRSGVVSTIFDYDTDEIVSALQRGSIPIALISTYRLTGDQVPHWVIVTGFDKNHIFIHDPDIASYKKNKSRARHLRIEKSEFLRMSRYGKEAYRCLLLIGPPKKPIKKQ